ncbi:MAG: hypothetical protein IPK81_08085 [Rhodospirillales bacterium]|nr:MAG: hypothetical protein IPK81_08085 [Rhodospirillales bacterium]
MRGVTAILVAVLSAVFATMPARAEVLRSYNTGAWLIEANGRQGAFEHCTATGTYGGGASVMFMVDGDWQWGVVINNPKWNWRQGSKGGVTYWVDNYTRRSGQAEALTETALFLGLADSESLFREIKAGNRLYIDPRGQDGFNITLIGTYVALDELLACVKHYK